MQRQFIGGAGTSFLIGLPIRKPAMVLILVYRLFSWRAYRATNWTSDRKLSDFLSEWPDPPTSHRVRQAQGVKRRRGFV